MDCVKLKINYQGEMVAVMVDDIDRVLLMDVINDMYDEAEKTGMPLPKHPVLAYTYQMKSVELLEDKHLLEMFDRHFGKNSIDIWIGCDEFPNHILLMARQLRKSSRNDEVVVNNCVGNKDGEVAANYCRGKNVVEIMVDQSDMKSMAFNSSDCRQKLQVRKSEKLKAPLPTSPFSSRSLRLLQEDYNDIVFTTSPPSPLRITNTSYSSSHSTLPSLNSNMAKVKFKMAKTTARSKGIHIGKVQVPEKMEESRKMIRRGKKVLYMDEADESDLSDCSYAPSDHDDVGEDEGGLSDLETENGIISSALNCIDDGYVPFQHNSWTFDDEADNIPLYANGEMFDGKDFGTISLRPWMLFMDKDHFKDVLKDFCIQEGFFLVVRKADSKRYSAECATINCKWRIHASVLADGVTWAIKVIENRDHGCSGLGTYNPMANADWAAQKFIGDIRANPGISRESIQTLLRERYGVEMKRSTLYRMKDKALKEINGSHDESYKWIPAYCEIVKQTNPGSVAHDESYKWIPAYCEIVKQTNPGSVDQALQLHQQAM